MSKLIARILILFTLLSNLGWAVDTYAADPGTDHASLTSIVADHHNDSPAGSNCHHSCHATAHLLTIPGDSLAFSLTASQQLDANVDDFLHSFIPAPPFQPPRA